MQKTIKNGFHAYHEISELAMLQYIGRNVSVQASIFGDEYVILVDGKEKLKGSTNDVRKALTEVK